MRCVVAVAIAALASTAHADDASPAREHVHSSATLFVGTTWSPGPTVPIRGGVDSALRLHARGLALEARLGIGIAASANGLSAHMTAHGGFSVGWALALGRHVVVAPMLAYDAFLEHEQYGGNTWVHEATIALPIGFVLERGVVIEAYLRGGVSHYYGSTDPAIVVGPRIGIVF